MRKPAGGPTIILLTALTLSAAPNVAAGDLTARIEVKGRYYRAGEPVEIRITLENLGEGTIPNPEGIPLLPGLELERSDGTERAKSVPEFDAATQPRIFSPGASYQRVIDLVPHFPSMAEAGTYRVRFRADGLESETVTVVIAPPYDPTLDYQATLKTDFGEISFDLLEDVAPDHVRNFVDLARRGFYDDTLFHMIAHGELIVGGDSAGDGSGGTDYVLGPEISTLPHERGTLSSVRTEGNDNGSQFFIDLRRSPERDGNFSIFGKLISGDGTLTAIENVATTGKNYQPFFKPLKDTYIRDVVIVGKPRKAEDEPTEEPEPAAAPGAR